jgi:hypothetical protein
MVIDKKEIQAQVEWALRSYNPLWNGKVEDIKAKWTTAGLEINFKGGYALHANFEGRCLGIAWQSMGEVDRYMFQKDCEELLERNVLELGDLDRGYLDSVFQIIKKPTAEKRILFGSGVQFDDLMDFLGTHTGLYYDLSNLCNGLFAVSGDYRQALMRERAFLNSLDFHVKPYHRS